MSTEMEYLNEKFICPHCKTLAKQEWINSALTTEIIPKIYRHYFLDYRQEIQNYEEEAIGKFLKKMKEIFPREFYPYLPSQFAISRCQSCEDFALWVNKEIVYPKQMVIDLPNKDMNPDIQELYLEAGKIIIDSPKGASALLRLALQKLLWQLGETDRNIDKNIKSLVAKGLNPKMQKALDFVRVVGNEAVHPGEINLDDNKEIAIKLFKILNLIAHDMISVPKEMDELYDEIIPDDKKEQINARDGRK